jgi:hypothetical protein
MAIQNPRPDMAFIHGGFRIEMGRRRQFFVFRHGRFSGSYHDIMKIAILLRVGLSVDLHAGARFAAMELQCPFSS